MLAQDPGSKGPNGGGSPPVNLAAQAFGIPSSYDPRFRINSTVFVDPARLRQAGRAIDQRLAALAGRATVGEGGEQPTGAEVGRGAGVSVTHTV